MLKTPLEVLKNTKDQKECDHLPFFDQIDQMVRELKGVPKIPDYKIQLTEQNYMKTLKLFVNSFVIYST